MNGKLIVLRQMYDLLCLLVQNAGLSEQDAVRFSGFYPEWEPGKAYDNKTLLRWGADSRGKPLLWAAANSVKAGAGAPDVTPGSYRLIG